MILFASMFYPFSEEIMTLFACMFSIMHNKEIKTSKRSYKERNNVAEIGIIKINWFNLWGSSTKGQQQISRHKQTLMEYISKRSFFCFGFQKICVLSYKHVVILKVYEQWDHELLLDIHWIWYWHKESPHDKQFICWKEKLSATKESRFQCT